MTRSLLADIATPTAHADSAEADADADTGVAALAAGVLAGAKNALAPAQWAEDEILEAGRRHPAHSDVLYHAFMLVRPRAIGTGMYTEWVYRSHAVELLERLAAGADTRPATAAELSVICCEASLLAPMHGPAAGLYFRMWRKAFPDRHISSQQADQVHYEKLFRGEIDELEAYVRSKAIDPRRQLLDVDCVGKHHGAFVACRYAPASTPLPAPPCPASRRRAGVVLSQQAIGGDGQGGFARPTSAV